ncbi:MAG: hypothetical protein ACLTZR_14805, partial [Parabacteroides merdae]
NDPEITNHVLWPTELKRHTCFKKQPFRHQGETAANLGIISYIPNLSTVFLFGSDFFFEFN